jgi:prepilin-type N-terminal cleavage/methylation domain-containing protein/prepilin-type processing-associated H-X9-DG protein
MHHSPSKSFSSEQKSKAFTLLEICVVISIITILAALLLIPLARAKGKDTLTNCLNNLKQTTLAFRMWKDDNSVYPMQFRNNDFDGPSFAVQRKTYVYFQIISNELSTPKIVVCPADTNRSYATNFTSDFDNSKVSYFVGLDAVETNATMFLAGDRNIFSGTQPQNGILEWTAKQPVSWTEDMHNKKGNIAFTDGSVQTLNTSQTKKALRKTGIQTNRLAFP